MQIIKGDNLWKSMLEVLQNYLFKIDVSTPK